MARAYNKNRCKITAINSSMQNATILLLIFVCLCAVFENIVNLLRTLPHFYIGVNLANEALEYITRTELVEMCRSVNNHLLHALRPTDGGEE